MRLAGLAEGLAGRHEVRVLAQCPPGFVPQPAPADIDLTTVPIGRLGQLGGLLRRGGFLPLQTALYDQPRFRRRVRSEIADFQPDVVIGVLSRIGSVLLDTGKPTVVDFIDCLGLNMTNRAERQPWLRPLWLWEARRMFRWERRIAQAVDATTVVSGRDRAALIGDRDLDHGQAPRVVPLGLPLDSADRDKPPARPVVLLSGNLGYFPTVEGALWFGQRVWPAIRTRHPGAEWWLAGARPAAALASLANELDGVRLIANPENLAAIRRQASVSIAPLRAGSGTPIKILEAMADHLPVVTTAAGSAGLDGLDENALQVADRADEFAAAVVRLLANPLEARQQASTAWRWLEQRHALPRSVDAFEAVLLEVLDRKPSR